MKTRAGLGAEARRIRVYIRVYIRLAVSESISESVSDYVSVVAVRF